MKHRIGRMSEGLIQRIHMPVRFRVYKKLLRSSQGIAKLQAVWQIIQHELKLLRRWWLVKNQRYGWRWRVGNAVLALLIIIGIALPVVEQTLLSNRYQLSSEALKLVGASDAKLQAQLKYTDDGYQFNQDAVQQADPMRALVGASSGKGKDTSTYALSIPNDFAKGTTYTDVNTQQSFQLVPQFSGSPVKEMQGHLVIPIAGAQAIYTLKGNGLKEDVVVPAATQDTMSFSYTLQLPNTLEAKVIPDSGGDIGIYSADATLYGNVSASQSKDQATLQKARVNGDKTNLVFGLPKPTIKTLDGTTSTDATARFELNGNTLSVVAEGLKSIHGAFTIDPSVVVTSASDFSTSGNNEGMISFDSANNQLTRSTLTGGNIGTWASTNSIASTLENTGMVAYNGYMYRLGGYRRSPATAFNTVEYAAIGSNGALGTWTATTSLPVLSSGTQAVAYNGYIYIVGGGQGATGLTASANVYYAPLNSNGTVGNWSLTSALPAVRTNLGTAVYNGYLYALGGSPTSGGNCSANSDCQSTVYYAAVNADGTLGSWSATTSMNISRAYPVTSAYNGYLYAMGGGTIGGFTYTSEYARINSDGTIGTWMTGPAITHQGYGQAGYAYNGYFYLLGGSTGGTYYASGQYAQINANGSLGTWRSLTSFTTSRLYLTSVAYNGYLYITGGYDGTNDHSDVQYAQINIAGQNDTFNHTTSLPTAANYIVSVAYNGYIYAIGGSTAAGALTPRLATISYAPINADGTLGTWTTAASFVGGKGWSDGAAVAYNGYLYLLGGQVNGTGVSAETQYAPINSDGSLGTWTDTTVLPTIRYANVGWAYNGYMYTAAGYHPSVDTACSAIASGYCNDVYMAPINSDGSLGSWTAQAPLRADGAAGGVAVIVDNNVWVTGGDGGGGGVVSSATIDRTTGAITSWRANTNFTARSWLMGGAYNGNLYLYGNKNSALSNSGEFINFDNITSAGDSGCGSRWCPLSNSMTDTLQFRGGVVYKGYMYALGGTDGSTVSNSVEYAPINNGGTGKPSSWQTTNSFSTARTTAGSVVANGYIYILGGTNMNATTTYNDVQYAPINADGTLGTWATTTSLNYNDSFFGVTSANGYIYILGGTNNSSPKLADVQYAKINSDGTLGSWTATTSLPASTTKLAADVYNGYMYALGGFTTSTVASVYYAKINSDGTIGSWTATTSFTGARTNGVAMAYGGNLYIMGGFSPSNGYYNDAQYAKINSDGTIGSWTATTSFTGARTGLALGAYDGFVYIGGGFGGSYNNDIQYAPILSSGALGNWQTGPSFTTKRTNLSLVAAAGTLYMLSGASGGSVLGDTQYTPLDSIARIGHYSKLVSLGVPTQVSSVTYNGNLPAGASNISFRTAGSDGIFGSSTTGTSTIVTTCTPAAFYVEVSITLDDSSGQGAGGTFADNLATRANATDFTVNYNPVHPPPNIRLRGGQTLQQGNLSQLDTCTP